MADNLKKKIPQDAKRINIHEAYELEYWSKRMGVSGEITFEKSFTGYGYLTVAITENELKMDFTKVDGVNKSSFDGVRVNLKTNHIS